jgi:hypothetical protein
MRLVAVEIQGFKRFATEQQLTVDSDIIALVGPNEAGKSAVLQAIEHLNHDQPFQPHELTRDVEPAEEDAVVTALYRVDDNDLRAPYPSLNGGPPTWFIVKKLRNGRIETEIQPPANRSMQPRRESLAVVEKRLGELPEEVEDEPADEAGEDEEEVEEEGPSDDQQLREALTLLQDALASDEPDLDREALEALSFVHEAPEEGAEARIGDADAVNVITGAINYENSDPSRVIAEQLDHDRPEFVFVRGEQRRLSGSVPIPELEAGEIPPGLRNVAQMGGVGDLGHFLNEYRTDPSGSYKVSERTAAERITQRISNSWRERVDCELHFDAQELRISVSTTGLRGYRRAEDRSDGLLAFIALVAAIDASAQNTGGPVILLVEHPEADLHIDAQADLVQVLETQQAAQQVIYTTHSPGALPTEMAAHVRAIVPGEADSRIATTYAEEGAGFTPLLLALGAGRAAFTPARQALIGEGMTEVYLLPAMIREALELDEIHFQVGPGGAHLDADTVRELRRETAEMAFEVDGDQEGERLAAMYRQAGVDDGRIIRLGGPGSGLTIEDVIDKETYLRAVNEELRRSHGGRVELTADNLGEGPGRVTRVKEACEQAGVEEPSKIAVARHCLRLHSAGALPGDEGETPAKLVADEHVQTIRDLYAAIEGLMPRA